MKNILSLLLPFAILISGCSQEELKNGKLDLQDGRIFTASFEQNETRTYVENGNLLRWNAGDQISLFDGNTLNRQYQFDGETGDNAGTFSIVNAPYGSGNDLTANYAVYPYASNTKIAESGAMTVTLPSEQAYTENSFGPETNTMVAVTKDKDDTFLKFKNVCGYLKLQLYGNEVTVKSITLTGNNNEKIASTATITPSYNGDPTISMAEDATETIALNCEEGVKIGTTLETATAFWIVVPPTTFEEGLTVTVTEVDGESFTKSTSNAVVVERNFIKPMAAFEVEIEKIPDNQIWYTSGNEEVVEIFSKVDCGANVITNEYKNGKGVITFDGEITSIGDYAFSTDNMLTSVKIPNSVTTIGVNAFYGTSLIDVDIPDSVTSIGDGAFYDCTLLKNVTIGCSVTSIGGHAFGHCTSLTSVRIPNSTYSIEDHAFSGCSSLTSVTIGDSVTTIGNDAFYRCNSLTGVYIANLSAWCKITFGNINANPLYYGNKLYLNEVIVTEITIPSNITEIKDYAFSNYSNLASVTIPNSVTTIGYWAFFNCKKLTNVALGDSVTTIGNYAFYQCSSLTSITIPNSVTSIGEDAFYNCASLKSVAIGDNVTSIEYETFCGCTSLTKVIIGNSVTILSNYAFANCTSLTEITIPERVAGIGPLVFSGCQSLKDIYCKPTTPPAITYFDNGGGLPFPLNLGMKIYVPRGSFNTYTGYTNYVNGAYPDNWFILKSYIEPFDF